MKLKKEQQRELKKIEATLEQINKLSHVSGIDLDAVVYEFNAGVPDITLIDRENQAARSKSRQEVFKRVQQQEKKSKVSVVR